ncbi:MAG TPA: ATP-dependent DNA helicase RecG [Rhodocyclaceae bacterium]|nr:ATP-dependent DNA helicase RecG [Rhodocyclaceae bacterium]HMV52869.1 ATP-dependent DNA helicase RecG [Rhodocyclaceae bacterium]HMZ83139.1 ATP-dependent DNA helicase RecG [Rhodocyclaceae bacterium]HNA04490.1 ATP-dependent DNA helicase RecG [Rhodocyclaceae bacterium]HNB78040.1 ATP-dependent DNA helicase RecG [Rhodocyclaceae bacterium]
MAKTASSAKKADGGNTLSARLARLGLTTQAALLTHLPLRYEDETRITALRDVRDGVPAQVHVEVVECSVQFRPRRQLLVRVRDTSDDGEDATLRFLNFYPSQQKQMEAGARLRVFGEARVGFAGVEFVHPRVKRVDDDVPLPTALTPVYPTTAGLSQAALRALIERALSHENLEDTLPEPLRAHYRLAPFADCLRALHHPPPNTPLAVLEDRSHPAWQRMKFDELLAQQISLRKAYAARRAQDAPVLAPRDTLAHALLDRLPFRLTCAQQRAWQEIANDLAGAHPMQRLLQGDVGSGKTIVAALAMLRAAEHGAQAALMAPTEILAEQHYRKLAGWLAPLGIEVGWLSGSLKKSLKRAMVERLQSGELLLAVGTHALIEDAVDFPNLALAVVDEQHRFGVRQRLALREKGSEFADGVRRTSPHQLMMSATPIPRTLAMSYYADLDVSVLDEMPPGRTPVVTKLVSEARRDEVIGRVREACAEGRQAYWVCPLIEESETLELKTAIETFGRLQAELSDLSIGLVHGRLKAEEKAQVMEAFVAGRIDLLVATTVIEVGVDVPNASLMVIEHAERFGLSQLHQLRGRVGRGAAQSACILLYAHPLGETARARLKIIYENTDGFEIARRDLELRGPGEFVGSRQSGVPLLRFADLTLDAAIVEQAREAAEAMLRDWPDAARAHLERWLGARQDFLKV